MPDDEFRRHFANLIADVKPIKATASETGAIKAMVEESRIGINNLSSCIEGLKNENKILKKEMDEKKHAFEALNNENAEINYRLNELEQYRRKYYNVIIHDVQENEEENITEVVQKVARQPQVEIHEHDICAANRLRTKKGNEK